MEQTSKCTANNIKDILDNCPRMVAVFMVKESCEGCRAGDFVYWNWEGYFASHFRCVILDESNIEFQGYAPTIGLNGEIWPDMSKLPREGSV